jgi:hypothetical protein
MSKHFLLVAFSGEEPYASPRSKINVYCPPDGKVEDEGASEAGRSEGRRSVILEST